MDFWISGRSDILALFGLDSFLSRWNLWLRCSTFVIFIIRSPFRCCLHILFISFHFQVLELGSLGWSRHGSNIEFHIVSHQDRSWMIPVPPTSHQSTGQVLGVACTNALELGIDIGRYWLLLWLSITAAVVPRLRTLKKFNRSIYRSIDHCCYVVILLN